MLVFTIVHKQIHKYTSRTYRRTGSKQNTFERATVVNPEIIDI